MELSLWPLRARWKTTGFWRAGAQVLLARRMLILKKQCWGLVEGSVSGTDVGRVVSATSPPQQCRARVRRVLRACQPAGPGRVGCFRSGCRLFDKAETTQWLVVSRVSLEQRGMMRYIPLACLCSGLMWSPRVNQSFCFEGRGGGRDCLCAAFWRVLEILQTRRLHPSLPSGLFAPYWKYDSVM